MTARSVAVVGASERPDAPSGFVIRNLLAHGFTGRFLPIHPTARTIYGHNAAPRLSALDQPPDAMVIAIPAPACPAVVAEAAAIGVKGMVVLASGFAETDDAGAARQREIAQTARAAGMALCGPNCLGLVNLRHNLALFSSRLAPDMRRGHVAIVSHSGAGAITLANTGRLGLSHIVSAGNAAVSDAADYLAWFAATRATRVVALMLEQIADPEAFARAMAQAHAADITVIALRSGRSGQGAAAIASHTGALAGSNEAFAAFFRRHGVIEAPDLDHVVETCVLASTLRRPRAGRLAALGVSGGSLAHVTDLASQAGLSWAEPSDTTRAGLAALLPGFVKPAMPLDMTGVVFADPGRYSAALDLLAADPAVGLIVAVQDAPAGLDDAGAAEYDGIAAALAAYHGDVPLVSLSLLSGGLHPRLRAALADIPCLQGATPGMAALAAALAPRPPAIAPAPSAPPHPDWVARLSAGPPLTEREAKSFLAAHGIPVTREALARTPEEAVRIAAELGVPVALKIESPDIPHKTEAGGVRLNLTNAPSVRDAFTAILAAAHRHAPGAAIAGVLVQEMIATDLEALVGLSRHPPFGLALTVGPGGVLVEYLGGHALDVLPLDPATAGQLIAQTTLDRLLDGVRGRPPGDRPALTDLLVRLSDLARRYGSRIAALDLNPVSVLPPGQGVRVLDALLIRTVDLAFTESFRYDPHPRHV